MESMDTQICKFQQQVKNYQDAIKAFEVAATLADKFDGKVMNKRFIDALNNAAEEAFGDKKVHFSFYDYGMSHSLNQCVKEIDVYCYDRCKNFDGGCVYIDNYTHRLYEVDNVKGPCYINKEGRLVKEIFLKAIEKKIADLKKSIDEYQYCADNFDAILDKIREENKRIDALRKEIPRPMYIGTMYLELPFWYNWSK